MKLNCYKVEHYEILYGEKVHYKCIYTVARSLLEVGECFPDAKEVTMMGEGHICGDDENEN